ncbi:integrase [Kitasatospora sp. NPDC096128]|uniref:integrase n=1 Tax=Kitasatospora sp. NPDC096128 TaxID=3155547 RepID=UPI003327B8CC
MSTECAAEPDPYMLPTPDPDSPVVLEQWISPGNPHPNTRYQELCWSLGPLIDNPSSCVRTINWRGCPPEFREQLKILAWTMINGRRRPTFLQTRGAATRSRSAPSEMQDTVREWLHLARWLRERGITDLAAGTAPAHLTAYLAQRWDGIGGRAGEILHRFTDLWVFDQLTACPCGVPRPPWVDEGIAGYLPAARGGGRENTTEPLDPQVLGPLLIWATRFVEDLADDILASWAERQRLTRLAADRPATPAGKAALEAYLVPLIESGAPLPSAVCGGATRPARAYIAAITGASAGQLGHFARTHQLSALTVERPGPCPLTLPVTGLIADRPWREHLDFAEAPTLMRHLGTAAVIICLYLTGMRPQEVQGLRSGCCPDPEAGPDGIRGRYLIHSRYYKDAKDSDGNYLSAGQEREVPWTAIAPVVRAIRVLERIVPDGELLLSAAHHDVTWQHGHHGALKREGLAVRINDFVAWANREAIAQHLPEQTIPDDPHGAIGLRRFRRTLAWHIARRPGGLIALAIQYGHMRTVLDARVSTGYGTRSRRGIHGELDVETALAAADTAARLNDRIAAGERISGPAARRALAGAATVPRFEGRLVTNAFVKKAAAFLARDGLVLFDNPDAHLICVFQRDTALCAPAPDASAPNQHDCRPGCGNAVRTDTHALDLRTRASELDTLAAAAPEPVGQRLKRNAERLREVADTHDATAHGAEALA